MEVEISNLATGIDLKNEFMLRSNLNRDEYRLRLFFSGNEIKDDHLLFQYNLEDDYKIQVMKSPVVQ